MAPVFFTPTKSNRGIPCQLMQRQGRLWAALSTLNPSLTALHAASAACSSPSEMELSHEITLLHEGSGAFKRSSPVRRWCQVGYGNATAAEGFEMRLNRTARNEVQDIADNLPESELEHIAAEVDAQMTRHKTNPLMPALCAFLTRHYDYPAIEMFDEDDEQHEAAEAFLREAMVRVARREMALGIYRIRHGNQEAA